MSPLEIGETTVAEIQSLASGPDGRHRLPHRFLKLREMGGFQAAEYAQLAADAKNTFFTVRYEGRPLGTVCHADNSWETDLFGKKMGVLRILHLDPAVREAGPALLTLLTHIIEWARQRGTACLTCKVHTDDMLGIHQLELAGFRLMDTLLDYVYDYRKTPMTSMPSPRPFAGTIRPADANDEEPLANLARRAFAEHFGRYHADEQIPNGAATRVYEQWIRASFKGWADAILVAEIGRQVVGLSIWKNSSAAERSLPLKLAHYSLGAVHPDYTGRGIFSALTYEGMRLHAGKADCLEGPTHINNYPVQHGYGKLGWQIADARHSFHRWIESPAGQSAHPAHFSA